MKEFQILAYNGNFQSKNKNFYIVRIKANSKKEALTKFYTELTYFIASHVRRCDSVSYWETKKPYTFNHMGEIFFN